MSEFPELVAHLSEFSIKRGDFVLKSGKVSPYFIDSKQTTCRPEGMLLVAQAALSVMPEAVDALGGLTMGSDAASFGTAGVAAGQGRMMRSFSVRKEVKDHGSGGRIAGALLSGDRAVIMEDTVSRGVSMLEAAHEVMKMGVEVVLFLAVVDRGGTAAGYAQEVGCLFRALVTAPDLGFPYDGNI